VAGRLETVDRHRRTPHLLCLHGVLDGGALVDDLDAGRVEHRLMPAALNIGMKGSGL